MQSAHKNSPIKLMGELIVLFHLSINDQQNKVIDRKLLNFDIGIDRITAVAQVSEVTLDVGRVDDLELAVSVNIGVSLEDSLIDAADAQVSEVALDVGRVDGLNSVVAVGVTEQISLSLLRRLSEGSDTA